MVQLATKRLLDLLVSAVLLVVLALPLLAIALVIKLQDGGSVFFVSPRAGKGSEPFPMLKLRTMVPNADDYLDSRGNPTRTRVTRFGRFLRRWSLDELPQIVNVFVGDMSFVGPRPVPLDYAEMMSELQRLRFAVRPGLTGLAQVAGRHALPWSQRIELDLRYVREFSLLLDLRILVRTLPTILDRGTLTDRGDAGKVDLG